MGGQLLGREYILPFGRHFVGFRVGVVERVDGDSTVDLDRFLRAFSVEHHAPAKPANAWPTCLVQNGVAPDGRCMIRDSWLRD